MNQLQTKEQDSSEAGEQISKQKKTVYLVFNEYRWFQEDWSLGRIVDRERTRVRCVNPGAEMHSRTYPERILVLDWRGIDADS